MVNSSASQLPADVVFEKQLGQLTTWVRVMRQAGLPIEEALQIPINDADMRQRLVRFWNAGGYGPTTTQEIAHSIGIPVFGVKEAVRYFGAKPTRTQLLALSEIPFTEAELRECKDSHILVAVLPLSVLDIRGKVDPLLFHYLRWYDSEPFSRERGEAIWQLVRKTPVSGSISKTWVEQQFLLSTNEETPSARVMIYAIMGHFLQTKKRLMENSLVRCSDVDSHNKTVFVGCFVRGLHVHSELASKRRSDLSVASSRKVS